MYLTTDMIFDKLGEYYSADIPTESLHNREIKGVFCLPQKEIHENGLYIVPNRSAFSYHDQSGNFIFLYNCNDYEISPRSDAIIIKEEVDIGEIWNFIQNMILEFSLWHDNVLDIINSGGTLNDILNACCHYDIDAWLIIDDNFRYTALTKDINQKMQGIFNVFESSATPPEIIEKMSTHMDDKKFFTEKSGFIIPYSDDFTAYCFNFFYGDRYIGRLNGFSVKNGKASAFLLRFTEYIGHLVSKFMTNIFQKESELNREITFLFKSMIEGEAIDSKECEYLFQSYGWNKNDEYEIIYMIEKSDLITNSSLATISYRAKSLRNELKGCIIWIDEKTSNIFCLWNKTQTNLGEKSFANVFSEFIRDNYFQAGISNTFTNLSDCRIYCKEAQYALEIGIKESPYAYSFYFEDYAFDILKKTIRSAFPIKEIIHPQLKLLLEYDKAHGNSDLYNTLKSYLFCNFNASKAAESLFIHRTTFIYRMNKINSMFKFKFDHWQDLSYLLLSFSLLETNPLTP